MEIVNMGRPPLPPGHKKIKINVAIDPDIIDYLRTVDNRSAFVNKAARILMNAYKTKDINAATRKRTKKKGASRSEATA